MKVNFGQVSMEGWFQDWKERRSQEKDTSFINSQDIESMLTAVRNIDQTKLDKVLDESVLRNFYDCGHLMQYWFTIHFKLQSEVKKTIVPILKKYKSITSSDLTARYNAQSGESSSNSKIEELEKDVSKVWKDFLSSDIYSKAKGYLSIQTKKNPTFREIKLDKSRLKGILEMFYKYLESDYDKVCDSFIFAEDHDEGFWNIYYKLENLVDNFKSPSGTDAEMEDFFKGFTTAIGACLACQSCFDKFINDLIWLVKRLRIVLHRHDVI